MRLYLWCLITGSIFLYLQPVFLHARDIGKQPLKVRANEVIAPTLPDKNKKQLFTFIGDVEVINRNLIMKSDKFIIIKREDKVVFMEAMGSVSVYDKIDEATAKDLKVEIGSELRARAKKMTYHVDSGRIVLKQQAYLEWQNNSITGDTIEFNINSYEIKSIAASKDNPSEIIIKSNE